MKKKTPREIIILVATAIILLPILVVIIQNGRHSFSIGRQIRELNEQARGYLASIERDSLLLEKIKTDEGLEEYARENFFMQRSGERVFIIED